MLKEIEEFEVLEGIEVEGPSVIKGEVFNEILKEMKGENVKKIVLCMIEELDEIDENVHPNPWDEEFEFNEYCNENDLMIVCDEYELLDLIEDAMENGNELHVVNI